VRNKKWFQVILPNSLFSDRHARSERGIQRGRALVSLLPNDAFRRRRINVRKLAGKPSLVGSGNSGRPFTRPRRAYPCRHSHSGVVGPGLSLRFHYDASSYSLTAGSLPRHLAITGKFHAYDPWFSICRSSSPFAGLSLPVGVFRPLRFKVLGPVRDKESHPTETADSSLLPGCAPILFKSLPDHRSKLATPRQARCSSNLLEPTLGCTRLRVAVNQKIALWRRFAMDL